MFLILLLLFLFFEIKFGETTEMNIRNKIWYRKQKSIVVHEEQRKENKLQLRACMMVDIENPNNNVL